MSEMVERVARAIFECDQANNGFGRGCFLMDGSPMKWGDFSDAHGLLLQDASRYRANAVAAIAAMREPTRAMDDAGHKAAAKAEDFGSDTGLHETICETVFKAMIDQALK